MKKTIGGQRLGSGKKMETELHNYGRSTHNLEYAFRSSIAAGTLVPFMSIPALNGDTFDINLQAMARTVPTIGPLFGSFKLQLDVFQVPIRLYQGILHNNPINIGMQMNQVYLPKIKIAHAYDSHMNNKHISNDQINASSLLRYLGVSGIGRKLRTDSGTFITRKFNAVPVLAYYDIFKNYYSNKQEDNAYVITSREVYKGIAVWNKIEQVKQGFRREERKEWTIRQAESMELPVDDNSTWIIYGQNLTTHTIEIAGQTQPGIGTLRNAEQKKLIEIDYSKTNSNMIVFKIINAFVMGNTFKLENTEDEYYTYETYLQDFPLENIDRMRNYLLSQNQIGTKVILDDEENYPYKALTDIGEETNRNLNVYPMNGLVVKTFQSDIFNNWVKTEWIDGPNGIAALTAISTASGSFNLDTLNFNQKLYNVMNRVAVSGGTYEDWQEAVYGEKAIRHAETPMYMGGMSSEIVFEEVVATAETETSDNKNTLGSLGGRGTLAGRKGGNIVIKVKEPSYIIGILSITPRVAYSGGNRWDMTEIDTIDDFHKPELDAIGFQELMAEQMAYWDTVANAAPSRTFESTITRHSVGKQPAWLNYMTNYDQSYGDFADSLDWMTLNKQYEQAADGSVETYTTYIDPRKFNNIFAETEIESQNFWINVHSFITARRKMSAKMIPNL